MRKQKIEIKRTARYFISGSEPDKATRIWFVLHGYAQRAEKFIEKFDVLLNETTCIIAPEGFHRFYVQGTSGKIGASWMTSDDREDDISDYVSFLDNVLNEVCANNKDAKIYVLGFSQGAATAARWVALGKINPERVVFWGGLFPPDMNWEFSDAKWNKIPVVALIGDEDEYYKASAFKEYYQPITSHFANFEFKTYSGKHTIYPTVLREITGIH